MLIFEIGMLIFIYAVLFLTLLFAIIITRKITDENDKSLQVAHRKVILVVILVSVIYIVPIAGMIISAFHKSMIVLSIIGFSMIFSVIPVTYLIIIPLLEKREIKFIEQIYGKNSKHTKQPKSETDVR